MRLVPLALCLLALAAGLARAEVVEVGQTLVKKILSSTDDAERRAAADELLASRPDARKVARWFAEGRAYAPEAPKGLRSLMIEGTDGKQRPYVLFVPADYSPERSYRLLIDLHGGVARAETLSHERLTQSGGWFWGAYAEQNGHLLAIPSGQAGAEWWTDVGTENVLRILQATAREYNVDENRVLVTGHSDGGSGAFYLALTNTTPFAGFVCLNARPAVAGVKGHQVYLRNFLNKPLFAVNTERDSLYPSASVKPEIEAMKGLGIDVTWLDLPDQTHSPQYLPQVRPQITTWMDARIRTPHPKRVVWEGVDGSPSRVHWLRVTRVGEAGRDVAIPDVNPEIASRVKIGVRIDSGYTLGIRIQSVDPGTPAAEVGLKAKDVITHLDGTALREPRQLGGLLQKKKGGDAFSLTIRRGEETLTLEGKFGPTQSQRPYRRDRPHGSIEAEVREGNRIEVRANRIETFEIYLADGLVDMTKPVVVVVNGKTVHEAVVAPDLRFVVEQSMADGDRTMVYLARLRITVPE